MTGTIVTFYSYKGGVGRSLALANTAAVLARWGYRVLCIDWDLDAPGLSFYFRPWIEAEAEAGLVDLVARHTAGETAEPRRFTVPVDLPGVEGRLDLLPAGSGQDHYVRQVQDIDWGVLYERHGFGAFLERCRTEWKDDYDFVLVDSRTGITDIGGICTTQLPEVLVMLFTANEQGVRGTLDIARRAVAAHDALPYDRAGLLIVPVLSRFEGRTQYLEAEQWRRRVATAMAPLVRSWAHRDVPVERLFDSLTVPYIAFWSFGENLPAAVESTSDAELISYSLETLAALLAHRLDKTGLLDESRDSYVAAAARAGLRKRSTDRYDVYVSYGQPNRALAGALADELRRRSLRVFLADADVAAGSLWSERTQDALTNASSLLVVVGDELGRWQMREVERFLRQVLDEGSRRPVIPVLAPGVSRSALPPVLAQFKAERLPDASPPEITTLSHRIARDIATGGTVATPGRSAAVQEDALDTLSDVAGWRLDTLRWQLVAQGVDQLGAALDRADDDAIRVATADLELVGPIRAAGSGEDATDIPPGLRARVGELIARLGG
jgi:MinD-like ATPase involved in chromosome partitioning or flagellar assembly